MIRQPDSMASSERLRYARVLALGARIGFVLLALSFLAYLLGFPRPLLAPDQLPMYWALPLAQYVQATHTPTGWGWVASIGKSDMLNLVGIAVLAATPAAACLAVLPGFARRAEFTLFGLALLQLVVLLAASINVFGSTR